MSDASTESEYAIEVNGFLTHLRNNTTKPEESLDQLYLDSEHAKLIAEALAYNTSTTSLDFGEGNVSYDDVAEKVAKALERNTTITEVYY